MSTTPKPLRIPDDAEASTRSCVPVVDADGKHYCNVPLGPSDLDRAREIVRAVNAYDDLMAQNLAQNRAMLEALEEALSWYQPIFAKEKGNAFVNRQIAQPPRWAEKAKAALARAGKGE